ncbi:peptidoglycan-binding domain-containing protein [Streptomyces laurentii]|uniref:peptidoglycan-binding domain-containing protein n=1 Tax=Streptomyces laurentii TaxID=39478 RepID=UPI003692587E
MRRRMTSAACAAALAVGTLTAFTPAADAAPSNCAHTSSGNRPTLRSGDTGAAVKQAQCLSNVWSGVPKLKVDGTYGSQTRSKIIWIQGCHGLPRDGVVGPDTWDVLYNPALDCD